MSEDWYLTASRSSIQGSIRESSSSISSSERLPGSSPCSSQPNSCERISIGSTRIQLTLPPDVAQAFLNSVEQSLNRLDNSEKEDRDSSHDASDESDLSQRRADAAVLIAESSLKQAGRNIAAADRYQVIVSVDAADITGSTHKQDTPSKRPTIKGAGYIARETARRIACDCSISTHITSNGEPMDIGRISRIWPNAMERAIKERDQHCQLMNNSSNNDIRQLQACSTLRKICAMTENRSTQSDISHPHATDFGSRMRKASIFVHYLPCLLTKIRLALTHKMLAVRQTHIKSSTLHMQPAQSQILQHIVTELRMIGQK